MTISQTDSVFNVMTHSVLAKDEELLEVATIGEQMYNKFIIECKVGEQKSVWDTMTKRKLNTFKSNNKTIKVKVKNEIINLREERGLMTRLLVISRVCSDINISELFSKHEFSVTPSALFNPEGKSWSCIDKAEFLNGIEGKIESTATVTRRTREYCVVINAMGFVNQLKMSLNVVQCEDLVDQFTNRIRTETEAYKCAILVFDSYDTSLSNLKQLTWGTRHTEQVQYNLSEKTVIKNIKLKELLSHPKNKKKLSKLFNVKCIEMFKSQKKPFVIAYGTNIVSNIPGWTKQSHSHP